MSKLIQYRTKASLYNGEFGGNAGWPAAGMGYVFVTEKNRLLVVDGGHEEDAESFLSLLTEIAGGIPTIDLWIVTHPHRDHYGVLQELATRADLREHVNVKTLGWYFPAEFRDRSGKAPCDKADRHLREVCEAIGAAAYTPRMGDTVTVDDLKLRFLFVPADCKELTNPNSLSLIFSVKSLRRTALITGDACPVTMQYCVDRYGNVLQSDILQLPHHGLCDTGNPDFYRLVQARVLLVPISEAGDRAMRSGVYGKATEANLVAEEMAGSVLRAYEGTVAVEL